MSTNYGACDKMSVLPSDFLLQVGSKKVKHQTGIHVEGNKNGSKNGSVTAWWFWLVFYCQRNKLLTKPTWQPLILKWILARPRYFSQFAFGTPFNQVDFGKNVWRKKRNHVFSMPIYHFFENKKTSAGIGKSWAMARSFKHFLCHAQWNLTRCHHFCCQHQCLWTWKSMAKSFLENFSEVVWVFVVRF